MQMFPYILELIVFVCGAVVMVLEMTGSRILAPYAGTSIIVWTSLIGVILGSLSAGYWWGGKLADKRPDTKSFSLVIFLAALAVVAIGLFQRPILQSLSGSMSFRSIAVFGALFLFAPASLLLGMISPYAAKLKMRDMKLSGTTVGQLYAISTLGSIFGTFLAGFWLVVHLGSNTTIFLLSACLLLMAFLAYPRKAYLWTVAILCTLSGVAGYFDHNRNNLVDRGPVESDTLYGRFIILKKENAGRPVVNLTTNPKFEVQSSMFLDSPDELALEYTKYYRLGEYFMPGFRRTLMIGGGAFSFPKFFLRQYPEAFIDVVEIDPKLEILAEQYFALKPDKRMTVISEDGRTFLNSTQNKYDAIYIDAFHSFFSIPFHLTTQESVQRMYDALDERGVVLANIISSVGGFRGKFLRSEYATYKSVFPYVYVFPVQDLDNENTLQNIILVAVKGEERKSWKADDPEVQKYLSHRFTRPIPDDMPVLTDDFAPAEQYVLESVRGMAGF